MWRIYRALYLLSWHLIEIDVEHDDKFKGFRELSRKPFSFPLIFFAVVFGKTFSKIKIKNLGYHHQYSKKNFL